MNLLKILFTMISFLTITMISIESFANGSTSSSPCPVEMVRAILTSDLKTVQYLLADGEDPNTSLDDCRLVTNKEGVTTLFSRKSNKAVNITLQITLTEDILRSSSLLHLVARVRSAGPRDIRDINYLIRTEICILFVTFGANIYAIDSTYRTPMQVEIEAQMR